MSGSGRADGILTSFVGTWHAHLRDGGDDGVVAVALADQVDDPVRDVLDGAAVQAVVIGGLQATAAKSSLTRVGFCFLVTSPNSVY